MKWIEFSRLNQAIEGLTPTRTIRLLSKDYPEEYLSFIQILALELPPNNLASKKAMKWITNALEVFDDEVESAIYIHGDIGEAMYHFRNRTEWMCRVSVPLDRVDQYEA